MGMKVGTLSLWSRIPPAPGHRSPHRSLVLSLACLTHFLLPWSLWAFEILISLVEIVKEFGVGLKLQSGRIRLVIYGGDRSIHAIPVELHKRYFSTCELLGEHLGCAWRGAVLGPLMRVRQFALGRYQSLPLLTLRIQMGFLTEGGDWVRAKQSIRGKRFQAEEIGIQSSGLEGRSKESGLYLKGHENLLKHLKEENIGFFPIWKRTL